MPLFDDLKIAFRRLRRSPLFVLVAAVTLALGIGLNVTIFTFVDAVLLRPPAVQAPEELVDVYTSWPEETHATTSLPDLRDMVRAARDGEALEGLFGYSIAMATLQHEGSSQLLIGEMVSGQAFEVLGVPAAYGRTLTSTDDQPGAARVLVVSWDFFEQRLGGDPATVGTSVRLNGESWQVVGVAPRSFTGIHPGGMVEYWLPTNWFTEIDPVGQIHGESREASMPLTERRGYRWMWMKGRLADGASLQQATVEMRGAMAAIGEAHPLAHEDVTALVHPDAAVRFHPDIDGPLQAGATALLGLVALVLLVACANIANMLLARAVGRRREVAVRLALGSGRWRLIRLFVFETLMVAAVGGLLALGLARLALNALLGNLPPLPVALDLQLGLDNRVLLFTTALTLLAGLVAALVPALQAARADLVPALKESLGASGAGSGRARQALVVVQVAVSLVLLVTAALVLRGLSSATAVDAGFDPARVAVLGTNLSMHGYESDEALQFYDRLRQETEALPGVAAAAISRRVPFSINLMTSSVFPDSREWTADDDGYGVDVTWVDEHYLDAVGLQLLRGRPLQASDVAEAPRVALITEAAAHRFWPDGDALGRRFRRGDINRPEVEVVGIVEDHAVRAVGESPRPMVMFSWHQQPTTSALLVVRSQAAESAPLVQVVRRRALELDPDLAFLEADTLEGLAGVTLYPVRAGSVLLGTFAFLGLFLAGVGLYGVVATTARRRQREMGIRVALGARPKDIVRHLLGNGLALVALGAVVGLAIAAFAGNLLSGILYGVSPLDPIAFLGATLVLFLVALLANLIPARRASRQDPVVALRDE